MHLTHLKLMRKAALDAQAHHARRLKPIVVCTLSLCMGVLVAQALAWLFWDHGASWHVKLAIVTIMLWLYGMFFCAVYYAVKGLYVVIYMARDTLAEEPQEPWHIV